MSQLSINHRSLLQRVYSPGKMLFVLASLGMISGVSSRPVNAVPLADPDLRSPITQSEDRQVKETLPLNDAQNWVQIGTDRFAQGQSEAALEAWQNAENAYHQANDVPGILGSQINQSQALQSLGLFRRAALILDEVKSHLNHQPDSPLKVQGLQNLGAVLQMTGDFKASQQTLEQSLAIAQRLQPEIDIRSIYLSLGNSLRSDQQYEAALQQYRNAQQTALPQATHTQLEAQLNQLSLLTELGRYSEAQAIAVDLLPQLKTLSPSRRSIFIQINWAAHTQQLLDRYPTLAIQPTTIAEVLAQAMVNANQIQDLRAESFATGQLGAMYESTQQWSEAITLTQRALDLAKRTRSQDISYRWYWQLGRLYDQQSQQPQVVASQSLPNSRPLKQEAIAAYSEAVEILNQIRTNLLSSNQDVQVSYKESVEPVYRELASLLLHPQSTQAELEQARSLIENLQLAELENFFRSACIDSNESIQLDAVDPQAAVIYPIILSDRLEVITSIPNQGLKHHSIAVSNAELDQTLTHYWSSLNPRYPDKIRLQLAQKLHDWLIQPTQAQLRGAEIKTLVFVLDGMLRNLPMASLHDGQNYVVENFGIAIAPGLQQLKSNTLSQRSKKTLVAGLTESRQGFSPLPGVQKEVDDIQTKLKTNLLLNDEFTEAKLQTALAQNSAPIVHLATHGQFSSIPEETFLLSWDQKMDVVELQRILSQARQTENPIELLVLSACKTASGDSRAALGLAGVAIKSGALSTLGTLWSVKDASTAALMSTFYERLTQEEVVTKAELLRQAQLSFINSQDYHHPFFWAPFVLVGNWQ